MKTFQEFYMIAEATYDASVMSSSQIRKTGEGGRIGAERKKSDPEIRRLRQAKPGEERKPTEYKDRKDIGTQRQADTRVQQPTQPRDSAAVRERAAAAAREERRQAALARRSGTDTPKPKPKDLVKSASKLLSKTKTPEVDLRPSDQPKRAVVGMSREKRKDITRRGSRKLRDLVIKHRAEKQGVDPSQITLSPDYDVK